ncbi:hypothetical protein T439DRAFT_378733 [Meredithblackwellia eburnea MCA 4105]
MLSFLQLSTFALITAHHAAAHIELLFPPPINSKFDPQTPSGQIDFSMTSPLNPDGSNYPCKGYNTAANIANLNSVATLTAGSPFNVTMTGSATHDGGSCQFAISYDQGTTFAVIDSIIGGCPLTEAYNFDIPSDLPSGKKALFAWTWQNLIGNREEYMNCAVVDVVGSSKSFTGPGLFRANTFPTGDCSTLERQDVVYPNPGKNVQYGAGLSASSPATTLTPCAFNQDTTVTVSPSGSSSSGGSGSDSSPSSSSSSQAAASSAVVPTITSTQAVTTSTQVVATSSQVAVSSISQSVSFTSGAGGKVNTGGAGSTSTSTSTSDASVPSSGATGGAYISCTSTKTFSLCNGSNCTDMGSVASGTECVGGTISAVVVGDSGSSTTSSSSSNRMSRRGAQLEARRSRRRDRTPSAGKRMHVVRGRKASSH